MMGGWGWRMRVGLWEDDWANYYSPLESPSVALSNKALIERVVLEFKETVVDDDNRLADELVLERESFELRIEEELGSNAVYGTASFLGPYRA